MMSRWGLEGMRSFEQVQVARKEREREVMAETERTVALSSDPATQTVQAVVSIPSTLVTTPRERLSATHA